MKPYSPRTPISQASFYWYDLETTGTNPKRDRIIQFAGQRTDEDLEPIGDPWTRFVRVPPEVLIQPDAALITGLGPKVLKKEGIEEWELFKDLSEQFQQPRTCLIGFNNISFDDEFLRYGMYRNLRPAYDHEWRSGNSRLDLLGIAQMTCALRPEGIEWPIKDGVPSFKLEDLAEANNLDASGAHDALTDVELTMGLARAIKRAKPRLWEFALSLRSRDALRKHVSLGSFKPIIHVSKNYSNARFCVAPVLPIAEHPRNRNQIIVVDLLSDLKMLLESSAEEIRSALFAHRTEREPDEPRPGIHTIALNRVPIVSPIAVLGDKEAKRLNIDKGIIDSALTAISACPSLPKRLREVYLSAPEYDPPSAAEEALYEGLVPDADADTCRKFWRSRVRGTLWQDVEFSDSRLNDLADRLKTRMAPDLMSESEKRSYLSFVRDRLTQGEENLPALRLEVQELLSKTHEPPKREVLAELETHMKELANQYGI